MGDDTLSELHNCEKCRGKLVVITADHVGITRCSYCGEIVDYIKWFKTKHPKIVELVEKIKSGER